MSTPEELTAAERAVLGHLDEAVLVESLMELVRIPSMGGTDAEIEVQEHAAAMLRDLDTEVDRWDIDLAELAEDPWFPGVEVTREQAVGVVGVTAGEGMPGLVLQGHLDVVPPGDPDNWLGSNPFSAEIREGAMFGRGTCDMKAGAAANLAVARTLQAAGVRLERPLALHFVVGEEDGGLGAFATLRRGHIGEAAVITEPTSAKIITATAGALTFRIEVAGRSAHGSMRKEGVSAFEAFLPIHAALLEFEAERNRDPDPLFVGRGALRRSPSAWSPPASGPATCPTGSSPRAASACRSARTRGWPAPASRTSSARWPSRTRGCARTGRSSPGRAASSPAAAPTPTTR